ncbi:urease accessory protein UreE [Ruegeria sp. WL0004]|uniref:Urease accessory protein UreE n=1 Tax=Ruegeria marisflavi TaxID=2984152 RepID=A0ABT2WTH4_9RHOB|nr:urease accessory protein UreE [Ruegeria sp. WL0004]MCU9839186.1 urease accessory protein UreE [Ruegeria sp. WL0004]
MQVVTSQSIRRRGEWSEPDGSVLLTYEERFLRRKMLTTLHCEDFLVDLAQTTSLDGGDAFELGDGRLIEVVAANEPLLAITGDNLTRLAWHIGNRHTPCQVEADRLLIRQDHVIRDMLERLGASVSEVNAPFAPEGGAYGHGRTHGHSHGHDRGHAHAHGH